MPKRRLVSAMCGFAVLLVFSTSGSGEQDENPIVTFIASKLKDPKAPFALIAQFKVKAGKELAFEAAFEPCLRETRKEPGSTAYYLDRDSEEPGVYVVYERWRDLAAATEHVKQPYFLALAKALETLVDGEEMKVLLVRH
jgi:quinol monooxygenase YgiN